MLLTALTLIDLKKPHLLFEKGQKDAQATSVLPPEHCKEGSLTFASTAKHLQFAIDNRASIIVVSNKIKNLIHEVSDDHAVFSTPNMSSVYADIFPLLDQKRSLIPKGIHSSAIVDPSAKIGKDVSIGPFAVIGKETTLEDNVIVNSHVVICAHTKVGNSTILHSHCFIGPETEIGTNCEIHPFASIGSDGFGYVKEMETSPRKIPQIGKVVLEDNVSIGAHSAIDRATFHETRIKRGAKLDNHCHISHNCVIGENTMLAAGFMTAGSTTIGSNCMAGGMVGIADHIRIADGVLLGGRTTVTQNIEKAGAYIGYPAMPLKEGLRNLSAFTELNSLKKILVSIQQHLGLKNDNET